MDENLSRGYVQFGKNRGMNDAKFNSGFTQLSAPADKYNFVYLSLSLAGMGFLLPYNSFIIAADYFQDRYPGTTVIFDMSMVYITVAVFSVLLNNMLIETLPLNTRITFGFLISIITLKFVVFCEIWWEVFGLATSYNINLIAVAIVSLGCTVQQSSFYGFTSMLPKRYTFAVMAGESSAGLWVSLNRILTKSFTDDERGNTIVFFYISIMTICMCAVFHQFVRKTEFVQFYMNLCQERNKITLEPADDVNLAESLEQLNNDINVKGQKVIKVQTTSVEDSSNKDIELTTSNGQYSAFSFSNPVYEPGSSRPTFKVEDVVTIRGSYGTSQSPNRWSGIKKGLMARWQVTKLILMYMISIGSAYHVTLCLYPGIISEIVSCKFDTWMPVILMTCFNAADVIGKFLSFIPYEWKKTEMLGFCSARVFLIPLFLLCAKPRWNPVLPGEGFPIVLTIILGVTNGIIGSVPMIQAPSKVPEEYRELTGNMMTLSYVFGLFLGSLSSYVFDAFLGPTMPAKVICGNGQKVTEMSNSNNNTLSILVNALTTVASTEKVTSLPDIKATAMTIALTTQFLSNGTTDLSNLAAKTLRTTSLPKLFFNATSHLNNTILHH